MTLTGLMSRGGRIRGDARRPSARQTPDPRIRYSLSVADNGPAARSVSLRMSPVHQFHHQKRPAVRRFAVDRRCEAMFGWSSLDAARRLGEEPAGQMPDRVVRLEQRKLDRGTIRARWVSLLRRRPPPSRPIRACPRMGVVGGRSAQITLLLPARPLPARLSILNGLEKHASQPALRASARRTVAGDRRTAQTMVSTSIALDDATRAWPASRPFSACAGPSAHHVEESPASALVTASWPSQGRLRPWRLTARAFAASQSADRGDSSASRMRRPCGDALAAVRGDLASCLRVGLGKFRGSGLTTSRNVVPCSGTL
jgi:hypothetical protein